MKRTIVIFGNSLPEDMIPEKAGYVSQQMNKEDIKDLQSIIRVSSLSNCWKRGDALVSLLNGYPKHRSRGIIGSKVFSPKLLAEKIKEVFKKIMYVSGKPKLLSTILI